jgi:hypothetical protein
MGELPGSEGALPEPKDGLPDALLPLNELRREVATIVTMLGEDRDSVVRADLAIRLLESTAKYEDVNERVVRPALLAIIENPEVVDQSHAQVESIRSLLVELRTYTENVKPSDVHAEDPAGFDRQLDSLVTAIHDHLEHEEAALFPGLRQLDDVQCDALRQQVADAVAHASSHPHPPSSAIGRAIVGIGEKLSHGLHDESTAWHPGMEELSEELKDPADEGSPTPPSRT